MKIALITGSSRGIGHNVARLFLNEGWKVYGISRKGSALNDPNFIDIIADLSQSSFLNIIENKIAENNIDLFVSNAGAAFEEPANLVTTKSYTMVYSVNVLAPMLLISKLTKKLESATIISISSVSDRLIDKNYALYCSSKAANTRYFESVSQQLQKARVINILPSYVDTPMLRKLQEGTNLAWDKLLSALDVAEICLNIENGSLDIPTGSNIIIVNNALQEDLESAEKLYGYNTDTKKLIKL